MLRPDCAWATDPATQTAAIDKNIEAGIFKFTTWNAPHFERRGLRPPWVARAHIMVQVDLIRCDFACGTLKVFAVASTATALFSNRQNKQMDASNLQADGGRYFTSTLNICWRSRSRPPATVTLCRMLQEHLNNGTHAPGVTPSSRRCHQFRRAERRNPSAADGRRVGTI